MTIYGIIGNRTWCDYKSLQKTLWKFKDIQAIVAGRGSGTNFMARWYAMEHNITLYRSDNVINDAEVVVAFWDRKDTEIERLINTAEKSGKEVKIFTIKYTREGLSE